MSNVIRLHRVGPETWGEKLRRIRETSDIKSRDAAEAVRLFIPVSHQRLLDLEKLDEPPTQLMRRLVAYLAIVAYGYNPTDFGLDDGDMPASWGGTKKVVATVRETVDAMIIQANGPGWSNPRHPGCVTGAEVVLELAA